MNELADLVQTAALHALGSDAADVLRRLRPSLQTLRRKYAHGEPPDFSQHSVRDAYVFAYHPHHCVLSAEAMTAVGPELLGVRDNDFVRVVVLGAGPAAELAGLTWMLRYSNRRVAIEAHLVDREPAWRDIRRTTLDATISLWWPGELEVSHHVADFDDPDDVRSIEPLLHSADLVVAQAVITEVLNPLGSGRLIEHVLGHFGAQSRLLIVDFDTVHRFREVSERVDRALDAVVLARAQFDLPAARPIAPIDAHLFDRSVSGLIPRRVLHCSLRLLARPGLATRGPETNLEPTASQAVALDRFRSFLEGPDRVFLLVGAAGTGKTTLFPALIHAAEAANLPVVLLAPTGQAARRLKDQTGRGGWTLHSHLYRFAATTAANDDDDAPVSRFVPRDPSSDPAVYIIDEASLIGDEPDTQEQKRQAEVLFGDGCLLTDLLSSALHADGSKVVLVGDRNQLPPVGEGSSCGLDAQYVAMRIGAEPSVFELREAMRHRDGSGLLRIADAALAADDPSECGDDDPEGGITSLDSVDLPPWLQQAVLQGDAVVVAARNADVRAWNLRVRTRAGCPADTPVVGDRVLALRTDPLTGIVNGDDLEVAAVDDDTIDLRLKDLSIRLRRAHLRIAGGAGPVTFDALIVDDLLPGATTAEQRAVTQVLHVDFIQRTGLRPGMSGFAEAYARDERVQALRVSYAYARTCHRAQGGEWENVVVDFAGSRAFGPHAGRWAYTALTRARAAVFLVHTRRASIGAEHLERGARRFLADLGLSVASTRTIQHGIQLSITDGAADGAPAHVDLYAKRGLPSRAVPSGPDHGDLHGRAVRALNEWAEAERLAAQPPLPHRLDDLAGRVATRLSAGGYDVAASARADYEVQFTISTQRNSATLVHSFSLGNDGTLGPERSGSAKGDIELLSVLRAALEHCRE